MLKLSVLLNYFQKLDIQYRRTKLPISQQEHEKVKTHSIVMRGRGLIQCFPFWHRRQHTVDHTLNTQHSSRVS